MGRKSPFVLRMISVVGMLRGLYQKLSHSVAEPAGAGIEVPANDGRGILGLRFRETFNAIKDRFDLGDSIAPRTEIQMKIDDVYGIGSNFKSGIHEAFFAKVAIAEWRDGAIGNWIL